MKQIGVRELRQNASTWLRRVEAGESFEITSRGRPVALLRPLPETGVLERLEASGRLSRAEGDVLDLGPPLKAKPGVPLPSEVLRRTREHER